MKVLISGASGFIGRALCSRLASDNKVIGVYHKKRPINPANVVAEKADLTDCDAVAAICKKHSPDVVIHCAGIAHQKIGAVASATYMQVNSEATENLAEAAAKSNPDVCFIFLSSVSVYGEGPQINPQITQISQNKKDVSRPSTISGTYGVNKGDPQITQISQNKKDVSRPSTISGTYGVNKGDPQITQISQIKRTRTNNDDGVGEEGKCRPSSDYAVSKLDAERRLIALSGEGIISKLVILRLAPVYDREWSFNLERRVFAPGKVAYLRFGSGSQRMSALARPNLVDFIEYLIHRLTQISADENNLSNRRNRRINVCDAEAYEFNRIIEVFKKSGIRPNGPVISVPLSFVWLATRIAGYFLRNKREWIHSCYDKLASDLVFDNGRMMGTGFRPRHSLETILSADYAD